MTTASDQSIKALGGLIPGGDLETFSADVTPLGITVKSSAPTADMSEYLRADAPRAGCTLVIHIAETRWDLDAYAPGYGPPGFQGLISSYASRPLGSLGIALDALVARGFDWRWALPQMIAAEHAYFASLGSGVTE